MALLRRLAYRRLPKARRERLKQLYYRTRWVFYAGNRFTCPCCGASFRAFASAGIVRRPNSQCPRCGSMERHRALWLYLKTRTDLFRAHHRVLHVAPEQIFHDMFSQMPNLEYVPADLDSPLAMVRLDLTTLPLKGESFDVVLCSHVLEHVDDDRAALAELYRVLHPNGWAILQTPVDRQRATTYEDFTITTPRERERAFGQSDHVRVYGRDYRDRLELAGFRVEVVTCRDFLDGELIERYCLPPDEEIHVCTKSR